jgi:hypothetical protein
MSQVLIGGFLVVHGLITTMIGFVAATNPNAPAILLPAWFAWWPGPFGRSWLFEAMNLGSGFQMLGGLVWLTAGLALIGGGIGWLGVAPLEGFRYPLLVAGASLGLVALALYFHPIYLAAVLINVALIALLWGRMATAAS